MNECNAWPVPPSWEVRMLQDKDFADLIHNRYFDLRKTILSQTEIEHTIDSIATLLNEAQVRHFQKWNILGINVGTPESGIQPMNYSGEIEKFKNWISTRLTWLDANMIGSVVSIEKNKSDQTRCRVFPNPASDVLYIESDKEIKRIVIYNVSGLTVTEKRDICDFSVRTDFSGYSPGSYFIRIFFSNAEIQVTRVIKK